MRIIPYTAGNEKSHKNLGQELRGLKAGEYVITIKKNRPIRSLSQNKYYWALISLAASHSGHTNREIEFMFKMDRCFESVTYPNGKVKEVPKDTGDMDSDDFARVCNELRQWITEIFPELIIPRKEDLTYIQWMKIEKDYNDTHSGF